MGSGQLKVLTGAPGRSAGSPLPHPGTLPRYKCIQIFLIGPNLDLVWSYTEEGVVKLILTNES